MPIHGRRVAMRQMRKVLKIEGKKSLKKEEKKRKEWKRRRKKEKSKEKSKEKKKKGRFVCKRKPLLL